MNIRGASRTILELVKARRKIGNKSITKKGVEDRSEKKQ